MIEVEQQPIKTISQYLDAVYEILEGMGTHNIIWFRGENSDQYKLCPGLFRKLHSKPVAYCMDFKDASELNQLESNIDGHFYRQSFQFFSRNNIANSKWFRYFLKQHYGLQTRLLDWTENALYALFFALNNGVSNRKADRNKNPKEETMPKARVWLLSPYELNNFSVKQLVQDAKGDFRKIFTTLDFGDEEIPAENLLNEKGELRMRQLSRKYMELEFEENEELYPIAIYPPDLDNRMAAQQSCFTMFGNVVYGLQYQELRERKIINHIDVDLNSATGLLNKLQAIGITYYSIYPDLDGLGKAIGEREKKNLKSAQNNTDTDTYFRESSEE
jgi:hypothetical protein